MSVIACLRQHLLRLAKRSLIAADINLPVLYPKPTVEILTSHDLGSKILPFTSRWHVGLLMKISRARIDEPWVRQRLNLNRYPSAGRIAQNP